MNYDWNVYMSFLNPVLPMHILLRRFLMEWNEGNGVHTEGTLLLVGSRSRSKQSGGKKTKTADSIINFRFGQDLIFGIELKCNSEYT